MHKPGVNLKCVTFVFEPALYMLLGDGLYINQRVLAAKRWLDSAEENLKKMGSEN
jgi:hypothetical protein